MYRKRKDFVAVPTSLHFSGSCLGDTALFLSIILWLIFIPAYFIASYMSDGDSPLYENPLVWIMVFAPMLVALCLDILWFCTRSVVHLDKKRRRIEQFVGVSFLNFDWKDLPFEHISAVFLVTTTLPSYTYNFGRLRSSGTQDMYELFLRHRDGSRFNLGPPGAYAGLIEKGTLVSEMLGIPFTDGHRGRIIHQPKVLDEEEE